VVLGDPTQPPAPWLGEFGRLLFPVGAAFAAIIGCEYVQGHYFSPPVPAAAIRLGIWGSPRRHNRISPSAS
jgi:hypothetical protein